MDEKKSLPVPEQKKLTLEEYKAKYTRQTSAKIAKFSLVMFAAGIGIVIFTCLLLIVLRIYEMHPIAGYVSIAPASLAFIFFYIVPLVKICKLPKFETNVDQRNARSAQAHNRKVRESLADNMIRFANETDNIGWYDEGRIGKLAIARQTRDNDGLRHALSEIYDKDVRKKARAMIVKTSIKVGVYTALSPSDKVDVAIVALQQFTLVKDLMFLYGYRPSDTRLMKVFGSVLRNALFAYGISAAAPAAANAVSKVIPDLAGFGKILSSLAVAAAQGLADGILTAIVGNQLKHYLVKEYHLQDILDGVVLDEDNEKEIMDEIKAGVFEKVKSIKKEAKVA